MDFWDWQQLLRIIPAHNNCYLVRIFFHPNRGGVFNQIVFQPGEIELDLYEGWRILLKVLV